MGTKSLLELLNGVTIKKNIDDRIVNDIKNNSRMVTRDDIYVAIKGTNVDGHSFCQMALDNGASAIIVQEDLGLPNQVIVDDTKHAYALICANYFGNPAKELKLIGVTGTNGKTSVTTIARDVFESVGIKTGLIGTIQIEYGDVVLENKNTTPDAYVLHKTLRMMVDANCECVLSEISSHALAQDRVYGVEFFASAFTNLTQDHLDYHKDMEDYYCAKKKLFFMSKKSIVNIDNEYGRRLSKELTKENLDVLSFGIEKDEADFNASQINISTKGVEFKIHFECVEGKVHFAIPGDYSVENALTAIGLCSVMGISMDKIISAIGKIKGVKGRSEVIYSDDKFSVICDYAHSPDGIINVLSSAKKYANGRIVALFGCGGDRDKTKRPLMAQACEKYADVIVVTSDNPRSEDPDMIIEDIVKGFKADTVYIKIADRIKAIEYALKNAQENDIIILLGKGHETYQILKDKTIHLDEREVVAQIMGV